MSDDDSAELRELRRQTHMLANVEACKAAALVLLLSGAAALYFGPPDWPRDLDWAIPVLLAAGAYWVAYRGLTRDKS